MNKFPYLIFTSLFLIGCSQKTLTLFIFRGEQWGQPTQSNIIHKKISHLNKSAMALKKLLKDFNQVASTYISDSEISLINKSDAFENKKISKEMQFLIKRGFEIAKNTNEHFDPTIGPLVNLWGFGHSERDDTPTDDEINKALGLVGTHLFPLNNNLLSKLKREVFRLLGLR